MKAVKQYNVRLGVFFATLGLSFALSTPIAFVSASAHPATTQSPSGDKQGIKAPKVKVIKVNGQRKVLAVNRDPNVSITIGYGDQVDGPYYEKVLKPLERRDFYCLGLMVCGYKVFAFDSNQDYVVLKQGTLNLRK